MSNGALPKTKASKASINCSELREDVKVQNSNSEFSFELKAKPKLTCIPESCSRLFNDLRKTQSMNTPKSNESPEKSWSVLFIGSKSNMQSKGIIM